MKCNNCNAIQATPMLVCPDVSACGTPFCPEALSWNKDGALAAYVDKIFSAHKATGSSIFYPLDTAATPDNFVSNYELTPCSGGCCCSNGLTADAVFEIQKSYVQLDCFSVNEPAAPGAPSAIITPANVTVNGSAVAGVTQNNGRYTADISNIIGELLNPVCTAQCLGSKAFILLQDINTLEFRVRFGFEGVVRSCGTLYRFKVYIANNEAVALPIEQSTSFAIAEANIPCIEYGNAPVLSFRFGGTAQVINPQLSVTVTDEADPCNGIVVNLTATLGITPLVFAEVVRNTLIRFNGAELKDDCACGMDGFDLYAGQNCCNASIPGVASVNVNNGGVVRGCGCQRNNN